MISVVNSAVARKVTTKIKDVDCSDNEYSLTDSQCGQDNLPIAPDPNSSDPIKQRDVRMNEKRLLKELMKKENEEDPTPELVEGLFDLERRSFFDTC